MEETEIKTKFCKFCGEKIAEDAYYARIVEDKWNN